MDLSVLVNSPPKSGMGNGNLDPSDPSGDVGQFGDIATGGGPKGNFEIKEREGNPGNSKMGSQEWLEMFQMGFGMEIQNILHPERFGALEKLPRE